ncbi:MAG: alpha/beta hydrolase [Actinomycetota bacterium]|nr:alpha/beta hydrolase [Actinomycetota bacterium]
MAPTFPTTATTSDGVEIAVYDLGGTGRPLVMAHATGLHGLVWSPVAAWLSGPRCIAFDQRGHGHSQDPPDHDFDWHGFGRDAAAVVNGLGLERPVGIGHSSGAAGLLLAEEAAPGTFAAIYCYEPVVVPADPPLGRDEANWLAAGARRRRDVFESRGQAYDHYRSKGPFVGWDDEALHLYVDHGFADAPGGGVRLRCRPENEALVYEMATANDCFAGLGEVRCPVMLVRGSDSDGLAPATLEAMEERLGQVASEVLPGLSHFGPLEDPPLVAASIRSFLATVSAG